MTVFSDPWRALPDEDHRYTVGISPGDVAAYFAPTSESEDLLAERGRWLDEDRGRYCALDPAGEELVGAMTGWFREWCPAVADERFEGSPLENLARLGRLVEPDFVLLRLDEAGQPITVGGCVCFPSSWRLTDKIGLALTDVHDVVPGLNAELGKRLDKLVQNLKPARGWYRSNWGLSAFPDRNQHLDRGLQGLTGPLSLTDVWFRREDQLLVAIPETRGVLFGIRLDVRRGDDVARDAEMSRRLVRGLRTAPDELLEYKRLLAVRGELLALFERVGTGS